MCWLPPGMSDPDAMVPADMNHTTIGHVPHPRDLPKAARLGPSLRRASDSDTASIVALIEDAFAAQTAEPEIRRLQERGYFLVLDRKDGGLAASIYVEMRSCRGHFNLLAVAPDCQGQGLGRRLVAVAEALCEAEGCTAMDLEISDDRGELPGWYRSLGYRECDLARASRDHADSRHVITMTKTLAS